METRLQAACDEKISQWNTEAAINAQRAQAKGIQAKLIEYPTGLQMMRFAEPFSNEFGMHYEVTPEVWDSLKASPLMVEGEGAPQYTMFDLPKDTQLALL